MTIFENAEQLIPDKVYYFTPQFELGGKWGKKRSVCSYKEEGNFYLLHKNIKNH